MKKKKNRKKIGTKKQNIENTIKYVCSNCGIKEDIPEDVIEYFDEINLQQLLFDCHQFSCEKCDIGIMKPEEESDVIIRGYGLYEGIEFK